MGIAKPAQGHTMDPLYVIFEEHLYNFQDSETDRKTFIVRVVAEYINLLRSREIVIPPQLERPIVEELASQVNVMLVKKIYGCHSIDEYRQRAPKTAKRKARSKYSKLGAR